jgi:hypothetical protein
MSILEIAAEHDPDWLALADPDFRAGTVPS